MLQALHRDIVDMHAAFPLFFRVAQNGKHADAGTNFWTRRFPKGKVWLHSKSIPQAAARFEQQ
jgi:hypothetical protein